MNAPSPTPSNKNPWAKVISGLGLILVAAVAVWLIRVLEDHVRLGKLLGVAIAGGVFGAALISWGLLQVLLQARRRGDAKQIVLVAGAIILLIVAAVGGTYWLRGATPPGDDFVAAIGRQRDDPAVARILSRLGGGFRGSQKLEWDRHFVTMRFDKAGKLEWVRLGGSGYTDHYRGQLPFGLEHSDTPEVMLRKMGPHAGGNDASGHYFKYPMRGAEFIFEFSRVKAVELFPPIAGNPEKSDHPLP